MATQKQRALIDRLEEALNIVYYGRTIEEASLFITTYLPEYRERGQHTPRQQALIKNIEKSQFVTYTGKTVNEASAFIDKHLTAYQEQAEELAMAMYDAMCVGDH